MASFSLRRFLRQKARESFLSSVDDLVNPFFWVEILVEFILCSFALALVIWALTTLNKESFEPSTTHFGIFAAFLIVALIEGYEPLSGSLLNPAAAWGFFLAGRMSLARALLFMVAEIAGAATGGMIGISLTPPPQAQAFKPIMPGPGISVGMGIAIEGMLTFNLLVVALSCTNPTVKTCAMSSFPLAFCIASGIMAAGTHTGGLQNPIVPFGPAVAARNFTMHFPVYWGGPFIGATVGALFYKLVTAAKEVLDRRQRPLQPEKNDDISLKNFSDMEFDKSKSLHLGEGLTAIHL